MVRELVNQPAGDLYPETFAQRAKELAAGLRPGLRRLRRELAQAGTDGLHAGRRPGERPPAATCRARIRRRARTTARGSPSSARGSPSTAAACRSRPTDGMLTMKCDMAGAATVLGALIAIARLKLPVNVTGYMGLVENMVSGNSYKLGDVLTLASRHDDRSQQHRRRRPPRPGRRAAVRGRRRSRPADRPGDAHRARAWWRWAKTSPAPSRTTRPGATTCWPRPSERAKRSGNCRCSTTTPSSSRATWPT